MLISNHVVAGTAVGLVLRRHPTAAFAAGLASHFVLDAIPHWGPDPDRLDRDEYVYRIAKKDGLTGLALLAGAVLAAPAPWAMSGALFGSVLPDLEMPLEYFTGAHMFPHWFQRFHGAFQRESESRLLQECATAAIGALVVGGCLLHARRPRR